MATDLVTDDKLAAHGGRWWAFATLPATTGSTRCFSLPPPYWLTQGYGVEFPFAEYERLADTMRRLKGKAVLTVNDHPKMREVFSRACDAVGGH